MRYFHKAIAAIWPATVTATLLGMLLSRPAQAVPVLIETEGLPGIDLAQRDSAGTLRLFDADDVDGDGMMSLVADLDPLRLVAINGKNGQVRSQLMYTVGHLNGEPLLFFVTGTEERLITRWNSPPTIPFSLGQPFSVAGGQITGFDAVLYRSPGIASSADAVDLNLTTLPLYTGPAQVGGLMQFQIIPEPSTLGLALAGIVIIVVARRSRIRV